LANRYHKRYAGENRRIAFLEVAFAGKKIGCRMEEVIEKGLLISKKVVSLRQPKSLPSHKNRRDFL